MINDINIFTVIKCYECFFIIFKSRSILIIKNWNMLFWFAFSTFCDLINLVCEILKIGYNIHMSLESAEKSVFNEQIIPNQNTIEFFYKNFITIHKLFKKYDILDIICSLNMIFVPIPMVYICCIISLIFHVPSLSNHKQGRL